MQMSVTEHHVSSTVVPPERDANVLHAITYEERFSVLDPTVELLVEVTTKICKCEKVRMNSSFAYKKGNVRYTIGTLVLQTRSRPAGTDPKFSLEYSAVLC